jgi:Protein of unknown function DUF262./Protein of unknown function (DUF1524).
MSTIRYKASIVFIALSYFYIVLNGSFASAFSSRRNGRLNSPYHVFPHRTFKIPARQNSNNDPAKFSSYNTRGDIVLQHLSFCNSQYSLGIPRDHWRLWPSKTSENLPSCRKLVNDEFVSSMSFQNEKKFDAHKNISAPPVLLLGNFSEESFKSLVGSLQDLFSIQVNQRSHNSYENYDGNANDYYYYCYTPCNSCAATRKNFKRSSASCLLFTNPLITKTQPLSRSRTAISAVSDSRSSFVSEEPMLCKHLKLGQLFSKSDEYVFRITKNIRFYEWTNKEVETMYNDFIESFEEEKYELNQMIVMKDRDCMEVADGQQRLISLCLLLAAMRDEAPDSVQGKLFAEEVKSRLIYTAYNKPPLPRVRLRRKDDVYFQMLLSGTHDTDSINHPMLNGKSKQSPTAEQLMMENYKTFRSLIASSASQNGGKNAKQKFIDQLFQFVTEQVYVYLTIPESHVVARKLIMGARKGKDFEPIDELKGLVIFNGIQDELTQDIYLEKWLDFIDRSGRREVAGNACLLLAQSYLGKRVKQNQEYEILEEFFREGRRAGYSGESIYDDVIVPGILSLEKLRGDASLDSSLPKEDIQRITFIRDAAKSRVAAKEVEIAAVHALLEGRRHKGSFQSECLEVIERLALLFLTTDVTLANRYQRVFDMVTSIKSGMVPKDLDASEVALIRRSLDETLWGASGMKSKIVVPIIMRLNRDMMLANGDILVSGETKSTLEHILPQKPLNRSRWISDWSNHDREKWLNRLGNLCLLHKRGNSSAKNHDFIEKKAFYRQSSLPLTTQIAQNEKWTVDEAIRQHKYLLSLADHAFGLRQR